MDESDGYQFGELTQDDQGALAQLRQGFVVPEIKAIPIQSASGTAAEYPTPLGVVVLTQTCDIVNWSSSRRAVQVAPVVVLDEDKAKEARHGRRPQYAALPGLSELHFADLAIVSTIDKARIARMEGQHGIEEGFETRRFGQAAGRKYNRYPFPDEVVHRLQPLESLIRSKHDSDSKPEGWALQRVRQIRISSDNGWGGPSYDIKLLIILQPDVLPLFEDDAPPERSAEVESWLYDAQGVLKKQAGDIAARLREETDEVNRYWLWLALPEAWAARCLPQGKHRSQPTRLDAAINVVGELWTADDFSMVMMDASEPLDLDHLSGPHLY